MASSPEGDLLQRIEAQFHRLSRTQKKVAEWIVRTYPQVALISAARLAEAAGASEATVVRLAMALGYEGYTAMQEAAREGLGRTLYHLHRAGEELGERGQIVGPVLSQEMANLRHLRQQLDDAQVLAAVDLLLAARQIHVLGARSSYFLAQYLAYVLQSMLGPRVRLVQPGPAFVALDLAAIGGQDTLVAFSFPRYTALTVQIATLAREKGCRVLAVTDSSVSPLVPLADQVLFAPIQSGFIWDSYISAMAVINCLIAGVGLKAREQAEASLRQLEESYRRLQLFHNR